MPETNYVQQRIGFLKKEIEEREKELEKIRTANDECGDFLVENTKTEEITEESDILSLTLSTISSLNAEIKQNAHDIQSIENSLKSLKEIHNSLDKTVFSSLEAKTKDIASKNEKINTDIEGIKPAVHTLLSLPVKCPSCNQKYNTQQQCPVCKGEGTISIEKMKQLPNTPIATSQTVQRSSTASVPIPQQKTEDKGYSTFKLSRE